MLIRETKHYGLDNRGMRRKNIRLDRRGSIDVASGPSNASILITNCVTAAFRSCHGEFV